MVEGAYMKYNSIVWIMIYHELLRIQKPWPICLSLGRPHGETETDDSSVSNQR